MRGIRRGHDDCVDLRILQQGVEVRINRWDMVLFSECLASDLIPAQYGHQVGVVQCIDGWGKGEVGNTARAQ